MATLSNADKQNLSKEQQDRITALKQQYAAAQQSGDTAGMEKAHADAEAIRNSAGYTGGTSGNSYKKVSAATGGQTADQVRQWVDDYTRAGYDRNRGWINGYSTDMNTRSKANYIRQQMQANSDAWHTADKATQEYLHQQNLELAEILRDAVGGAKSTYNEKTGQWENYNPNLGYGVDVTARDMPQVANSWKNYLGYTDADIQRLSNDKSRYSNFVDYNNQAKGVDNDADGFSGRYEAFADGPKTMLMGAASGTRIFDYNQNMEGHDRVYAYNPSGYTNQFTDYTDNGVIQPNVLSAMYGGANNTYTRQTGGGSTVDANVYDGLGNKTDYRPNTEDDTAYREAQKEYLKQTGKQVTGSAGTTGGSFEDYLNQMYGSALAAQLEGLKSSYEQNLSDLDASGQKTDAGYVEQKRQTTGDAAQAAANWREMANAYGLNSGAIGQANLAQNNQLQSNLNTLGAAQAAAQEEIERQRTLLGQQYQAAINQARAENNYQLAQALYQEAVRAEEALVQQQQYNSSLALQYAQMAMQQNQWQQEFDLKNGIGTAGSSGGSGSGGSSYSGSSYSSGGGTGSTSDIGDNTDYQKLNALYAAAANSVNPSNYIASHYKDYGFSKSTGLSAGYNAWVKGQQRVDELNNRFANTALGMNQQDKVNAISGYYKQGLITEAQMNALLDQLGV